MKFTVGCMTAVGLMLASTAQAQVLPPMRGDAVQISDVEDAGPYAAMPPRYREPGPSYSDGPPRDGYGYAPAILPPQEIHAILREAGFSPLGALQQRGPVYTVAAVDRRGDDGRMVIDARSGRILRFTPAYQMGERIHMDTVARYGSPSASPELPQYRRPPFDANTGGNAPSAAAPPAQQKVASRTATVPLPKPPPVRAVATPAKPVAVEKPPVIDKPIAEKPAEPVAAPPPAPVQQSAVTQPAPTDTKPAEPAVAAPTTQAEKSETPPTVAPPPTEAKPEPPAPTGDKPVVQGLE